MICDVDTSCPACNAEDKCLFECLAGFYVRIKCQQCNETGPQIKYQFKNHKFEDLVGVPLDVAIERAYNTWHEQHEREEYQAVLEEMNCLFV